MPTVTPVLRTQKADRRGRAPVWLRVSDRDGSRFLSLGVKVLPSQWNPRQGRVRKGHPNAGLVNALIAKRVEEAEAEVFRRKIKAEGPTAPELKGLLQGDASADFLAFAERYLRRSSAASRHNKLTGVVSKFRAFARSPLPFDRIIPRLLREYEADKVRPRGGALAPTGRKRLPSLVTMELGWG